MNPSFNTEIKSQSCAGASVARGKNAIKKIEMVITFLSKSSTDHMSSRADPEEPLGFPMRFMVVASAATSVARTNG